MNNNTYKKSTTNPKKVNSSDKPYKREHLVKEMGKTG